MMKLSFLLMAMVVSVATLNGPKAGNTKDLDLFSQLGVNLAGAEFGAQGIDFSNKNPGQHGKDYIYPGQKTMEYFVANGLRLFRIPFRWERIQPQLGKPLDPEELSRLKAVVKHAAAANGLVILDLHNYGRYRLEKNGEVREEIIGHSDGEAKPPVTTKHLCDLWRRLALEFRNEPAVVGYGIMNEPHDMSQTPSTSQTSAEPPLKPTWHAISREVVHAIRSVDSKTVILVPGDRWSSARWFPEANGPTAWIDPRIPNIVYEAHLYFDRDGSGHYQLDYDKYLAEDPLLSRRGADHVRPFLEWCKRNKVHGFIGEFGVPSDPRWLDVLDDFLKTIDASGVGGCYWAAGPWWGDYPLSIQPDKKTPENAPQMKILKRYTKHDRR